MLVFALLALTLASCTHGARPEGMVENWLRSLNQRAAGRPDVYASDAASQQVVPGWQNQDPGRLDTIQVFDDSSASSTDVLFRVVDVDGRVTAGTAHLEAAGDTWRVSSVDVVPGDISVAAKRDAGGLPAGWPIATAIAGSAGRVTSPAAHTRG